VSLADEGTKMVDPVLVLSLVGIVASMVCMMVNMSALNSYTASLGMNPRHVPFGKIWQDTQNPAYYQMIGFMVSAATLIASPIVAITIGHHSFPLPHHPANSR